MPIVVKVEPTPGHIAVLRDDVEETEKGLYKPETVVARETARNIFALVVEVGAPLISSYGIITPPCERGDLVVIVPVGLTVPLGVDDEGKPVEIYILPFSGVQCVRVWECSTCAPDSEFKRTRKGRVVCEKCEPRIAMPSAAEVLTINRKKVRNVH